MAYAEDYKKNSTGQMELYREYRSSPDTNTVSVAPPSVGHGSTWVDPEFGLRDAIQGEAYAKAMQKNLAWKRPKEIRRNPVLYTKGRSRYDVGQGGAGTCWFLATVSAIADKPQLLDKVIPGNAYSPEDGTFHARFWQFGQWEDVYIDDYLPVIYGDCIWGAHSKDEEEMWISLLEKAFAKHHGSYNAVDGGNAVDAFPALTGGVSESVDHKDVTNPDDFYVRINNAIKSGSYVISSVPTRNDRVFGLVGGHAYTMTGTAQVRGERLLRLRNPWGTDREWTGRWSDKSETWNGIPPSEVPHADRPDGEFWVSFDDFWNFFSESTICSLMPDFDKDGRTDTLDYIVHIYGQWVGPKAAGFRNKLGNPKYLFTVPDEDDDVPVVVQLIQKKKHNRDSTDQIRCDLFKIQGSADSRFALENMGTKTKSYTPDAQRSFRFRLKGGNYCVVPSASKPGIEREFLIRVFTPLPLSNVREVDERARVVSYELQPSLNIDGMDYQLSFCRTEFGTWRSGENAGGQISHQSHHINPQYKITITQNEVPLLVRALQETSKQPLPVGLQLYSVDSGDSIPFTYKQLREKRHSGSEIVHTTDGAAYKFIRDYDFDATYMLRRGDYLLIVHSDTPAMEGDFALVFKSTAEVQIKGHQTGM